MLRLATPSFALYRPRKNSEGWNLAIEFQGHKTSQYWTLVWVIEGALPTKTGLWQYANVLAVRSFRIAECMYQYKD